MEIKTCEEYVLGVLAETDRENERLRERVSELEAKLAERPEHIDRYVMEQGREIIFECCVCPLSTDVIGADGDVIPFVAWCEAATLDTMIPADMSKSEFLTYFEPEFQQAYASAVFRAGRE